MATHTSRNSVITQFLSSTTIIFSLGLIAISTAHAEQYCKSVDKAGNATYTLAPTTGCSSKKYKTIAIHHHISPPVSVTAPSVTAVATTQKSDSTKTDTTISTDTKNMPVPIKATTPPNESKLTQPQK